MRILFAVGNFGFLRNFEPALRLLAQHGHDLHFIADRKDSVGGTKTIDLLAHDYPSRISSSYAPSRKDAPWQPLATQLRLSLDYWRYLHPRYDHSPSLRARGASQAPALAGRAARWPLLRSQAGFGAVRRLVRAAERAMPYPPAVEALLRQEAPDLLLVTPLLYFGSPQVEYVRAAKALGIRTVLAVGSWDHLTTKGLVHELPDHVLVWNEMQRQEAAELHGIDASRVTVTGAQAYDHWFVQQPSLRREDFCRNVGLPDDRPLLLYLCSSPFITPHEVPFVRRWVDAVRGADDPGLRRAAILIRPHPQNAEQWSTFDPSAYDAVGIWPRAGANPVDRDARADYFDSMHYSVAVVGINTSALIESGIVGRPVFSVIAEEFSGQQEGTLHFQHLKQVNGGLLHVGATLQQHLAQLTGAVRGGLETEQANAAKSRAFVEAFIRPHGLETPAAQRFVAAIEAQASAPRPEPSRPPVSVHARRMLLLPLAAAARAAVRRRQAQRAHTPGPVAGRPLKIMFVVASPEYLRYYDSTLRLLADLGHHVVVGVNWLRERKHARLDLIEDTRVEVAGVVPKRLDFWTPFARSVRGTMDFARYLDPHFADAPLLRDRMYRRVLPAMLRPLNRIRSLRPANVARLLRALQALERAIPLSLRVTEFLQRHQPDVIVVSPLIDAASDQVDTVRVARRLGIPVIAGIASWDNLTNKGHMRVAPDLVTVWNRHQKAEAIELHGMPADKVVVTGAQLFDRWFERQPTMSRQEFCAQVGLPDDRPFVLFTGSSVFIARSQFEVPFVRRWIEAMRRSEQRLLRDSAVLVRPHPFNSDAWIPADFSDLGPTAIWPRAKYTPASEEARASFFNSLYFCDAVVGINTSAMIEAAILRKPVLSMLTPDFAGTQEGTLHFRYLLPENGGFLRVAESIEEHLPQLAAVLHDPALTKQQTESFVSTFLRPYGLSSACTPILADTIVRLGERGPRPPLADTLTSRFMRVLIWPLAAFVWFANLGGDIRIVAWRAAYETFAFLRRSLRLALQRVRRAGRRVRWLYRRGIVSPARLSVRAVVRLWRFCDRLARVAVRLLLRFARNGRVAVNRGVRVGRRATVDASRPLGLARHRLRRGLRLLRDRVAVRVTGRESPAPSVVAGETTPAVGPLRATHSTEPLTGPFRGSDPTTAHDRPLRILFSMRNFWYVRIFESAIQELADRGHTIHIMADYGDGKELAGDWNGAAAAIGEGRTNITFSFAPRDIENTWVDLRIMSRLGLDYLRFLAPEYGDAQVLERRARDRTPPLIVALTRQPGGRSRAGRGMLAALLRLVEGVVPIDDEILAAVQSSQPDLVLLTPLVTLGSEQQDVLRAARRLGIPSALCVGSWDHLSSKALIRPMPDRVLVWNEQQRQEALAFHRVPADSVDVTGAQCFDVWFDRQPSRDRASFCGTVGLDPAQPYLMYACSALFEGSPNEAEFVVRWIEALRASESPLLREAGVLVRAHPKRAFEWDSVDVSRLSGVTLWPPRAEAPFNLDQKMEYFDSLYHSAAIVGLNTSALIEGGILGRPVHTVLLPEFRDNQEGTLHFHYLLDGGLLRATRDLPSHITQLAASVAASDPGVHHNRTFVESFVRPHGVTSPATPAFADAVERLGALHCRPESDSILRRSLRLTLLPLARRTSGTFAEKNARARRRRLEDREREVERAEKAKAWAAARALKRQAREARVAEEERQRQERALARARERDARYDEKRARLAAIARERQEEKARAAAEKLAARQRLLDADQQQKDARLREKAQRIAEANTRKARERRRAMVGSLLDRLKAVPMSVRRALGFAGRGKSGV